MKHQNNFLIKKKRENTTITALANAHRSQTTINPITHHGQTIIKTFLQHSKRKQVTEDQNDFEHKPNTYIHIHIQHHHPPWSNHHHHSHLPWSNHIIKTSFMTPPTMVMCLATFQLVSKSTTMTY